jgi:hypothetical protein
MTSFEVGDRVRLTRDADKLHLAGRLGTIVDILRYGEFGYRVAIDDSTEHTAEDPYPFAVDEIELYPELTAVPTVTAAVPEQATLFALIAEVASARSKFPDNKHLLAALTEEVGELAEALLQVQGTERVRAEAIQVATVALRIFEEGDASFNGWKAT